MTTLLSLKLHRLYKERSKTRIHTVERSLAVYRKGSTNRRKTYLAIGLGQMKSRSCGGFDDGPTFEHLMGIRMICEHFTLDAHSLSGQEDHM